MGEGPILQFISQQPQHPSYLLNAFVYFPAGLCLAQILQTSQTLFCSIFFFKEGTANIKAKAIFSPEVKIDTLL